MDGSVSVCMHPDGAAGKLINRQKLITRSITGSGVPMGEARFIEDLSVGAKRYWLLEPLQDHERIIDYVIVAPEPSSGHTSVYAATDHGDIADVTDDGGSPVTVARFDGDVAPEDALARLGYEVSGSDTADGMTPAPGRDEPDA